MIRVLFMIGISSADANGLGVTRSGARQSAAGLVSSSDLTARNWFSVWRSSIAARSDHVLTFEARRAIVQTHRARTRTHQRPNGAVHAFQDRGWRSDARSFPAKDAQTDREWW